jgi:NADH-quinone oxidoreductase subunit H
MKALTDSLIQSLPFLRSLPYEVVYALVAAVLAGLVLAPVAATIAGILTWVERRVAGRMQNRYGPNRVGPEGFFQWIADAVKLIHKEQIVPTAADSVLFRIAPYLVFLGMFLTFAVIPFGPALFGFDLNIGIFYLLAITSLVVVGVLMAGWASNNKWALLGGFRSAAQIVSYEIPAALSIGAVVLLTGSLSMQDIVKSQGGGGGVLNWHVLQNPFLFIATFIFFTSALAEINRTPFDIPEAESELVSGYNTEYSGMPFAIFFLAEYANVFVASAITATVFLGGWQLPFPIQNALVANLVGLVIFMLKAGFLCFIVLWLRWSLPRLRVDQLMSLSWKYLTPIAFFNLFGVAVWMLIFKNRGIYQIVTDLVTGR